ncbi:unnamed protein product [Alopecurus aequalis]
MKAPQERERERTMRDLYDRTRHKDLALLEESSKERGRGGGGRAEGSKQHEVAPKMEDNPAVRKRPVPCASPRVKAESGTCNLCSAPCSSCLHRNLAPVDSNMDCGSSQTCCARSESKGSMLVRSGKGLHTKVGENEDEFSATSSHASYSENAGHKVMARSSVAADSEVDMPAKRRRLLNHDPRLPREECHDDSNSCVTGTSAASKLLLAKKKDKLSTSASSRDLTVNDYKDKTIACHNKLRNSRVEESTEKKRSDHIMQPSSFDRSAPADSPSFVPKKLLRTQSSASASQGLSPKRPSQGLAQSQDNLAQKTYEKVSNNNVDQSVGEKLKPSVIGGDKHGMLTSMSKRNKIKVGSSSKELESGSPCSRNISQEHAEIGSVHVGKSNSNVKEDQNQDLSMDISTGRELNTQNDAMTECGNSESLIDVNVCDICGDVGREFLLATCTRCLEGAEHTYCMRVKLDKVPNGEWLCEECQLNEDRIKTRSNRGAATVDILDGKNQNSENMSNPKTLQIAVANLDSKQIACGTPKTNHLPGNDKKLHSLSIDPEARQVKCATPTAERLDSNNKNFGSMANRKRLQIVTSDTDARPPTCGTPTGVRLGKKIQSSEDLMNRKKLRIATDIESPLSSEGLLSPPKSLKRHAENASSSDARLSKTESPRKHDIFSRQNSFKKSDKGNFKAPNNAPARGVQAVKSSVTLSRSYSVGSMANVKAPPVPSPRGPLSKQLSFNNSNSEPKVKQLAEGVSSKLKPVKHSSIDVGEKGTMRKLNKPGSFKHEGSVKDSSSIKQKQPLLLSLDEKPRMLKLMSDKRFLERRASFNLQKPNIPSPPRPDCSMKSGEQKIDQDNPRPGPSILKTSKKPGTIEKTQSSVLSKKENGDITVRPALVGAVSAKDACAVETSYPLLPVENVNKDSDCAGEASFISLKNDNEVPTNHEALSTPLAVASESDLQDMVPRASASEDLIPNVGHCQQDIVVSTGNKSSKIAEVIQASEDKLPKSPHGPIVAQKLCAPETKLIEPNLKHQDTFDQLPALGNLSKALVISEQTHGPIVAQKLCAPETKLTEPNQKLCAPETKLIEPNLKHQDTFNQLPALGNLSKALVIPEQTHGPIVAQKLCSPETKLMVTNLKHQDSFDQLPALGNLSRALVIPEQTYIWQGIFEVSRPGNSSEIFDGIQAHLSTSASHKALEVVKQLPQIIQLVEVPRCFSWPQQFKEVQPNEDNIALFFFAKDIESYERAYGKLLERMLVGDLSLTANISGFELLILSSDKLPVKIQRWNGLLYFWGVFYAGKANRSTEPVRVPNPCPLESISGPFDKPVCSPKVAPSLDIDLNQCPGDEFYDQPLSLESETEKFGSSEDHHTFLRSKHEDEKLDVREIHHEGIAVTREIVLGSATAVVFGANIPTSSGGHNIKPDYPSDTTGKDSMEDEEIFSPHAAQRDVEQHAGAGRLMSDDILAKRRALTSLTEVCLRHSSESMSKADFVMHDSGSNYKRQKTFNGDELPSMCLSKMHSLPAGWRTPVDKGLADLGSTTKTVSDHLVHVLSSDDEDSPEPSTTMNKASLKAEEGSSPLLSLSLSTVAKARNLASSDRRDDRSLSLSLGPPLPGVAKGNQDLEIKQFLPEKPGINTSFLL